MISKRDNFRGLTYLYSISTAGVHVAFRINLYSIGDASICVCEDASVQERVAFGIHVEGISVHIISYCQSVIEELKAESITTAIGEVNNEEDSHGSGFCLVVPKEPSCSPRVSTWWTEKRNQIQIRCRRCEAPESHQLTYTRFCRPCRTRYHYIYRTRLPLRVRHPCQGQVGKLGSA